MDLAKRMEKAVSSITGSIGELSESIRSIVVLVDELEEDIEILFESQDMNVWVIVKGIVEGSIAPGNDPEDVLRAISRLQSEYKACVALATVFRRLGKEPPE